MPGKKRIEIGATIGLLISVAIGYCIMRSNSAVTEDVVWVATGTTGQHDDLLAANYELRRICFADGRVIIHYGATYNVGKVKWDGNEFSAFTLAVGSRHEGRLGYIAGGGMLWKGKLVTNGDWATLNVVWESDSSSKEEQFNLERSRVGAREFARRFQDDQ